MVTYVIAIFLFIVWYVYVSLYISIQLLCGCTYLYIALLCMNILKEKK